MTTLARIAILVVLATAVTACSRERQDWQAAERADTIEAYDAFVTRHPGGERATQARARVKQLAEEREWRQAALTDTLEAYQLFLLQHPQGAWAQEARIRIENFALAAAPATTPATATKPASSAPATTPTAPAQAATTAPAPSPKSAAPKPAAQKPAAAPKPTAATKPAAPAAAAWSGYGIQLGAFGSDARARSEWTRLRGIYASELADLSPTVMEVRTSSGVLHRLRAKVPSEAQARKACDALKARGQACLVVLPGGG